MQNISAPSASRRDYTILIPVFDETAALQFSKFYFDHLGYRPIYVLDSKRLNRRSEVERLLDEQVFIYENSNYFPEANFENLVSFSPTDWIFRVDCDEVPNGAALDYCATFTKRPTDIFCGFDRDDLVWRETRFERLKYAPLFFDSQYRLFNRRKVKFLPKIHTPGFHVPVWKFPMWPKWHAPPRARIYHLNRVFMSQDQRLIKMQRYNEESQHKQFDEWNRRSHDSFTWIPLKDKEFAEFFQEWLKREDNLFVVEK